MKQLEHRLKKLEAAILPASHPALFADAIDFAFARIWMTLAMAGLGNPRPDEPLRQAWSRVVEIVDTRRLGFGPNLIATLGGMQAYFPDNNLKVDMLFDAIATVPAWLDVFARLNVARDKFGWPLRDVFNEADPMTPAAAVDLMDAWPHIPGGAYLADFADEDARARWDSLVCGSICEGFSITPLSASMNPTVDSTVVGVVMARWQTADIGHTTPEKLEKFIPGRNENADDIHEPPGDDELDACIANLSPDARAQAIRIVEKARDLRVAAAEALRAINSGEDSGAEVIFEAFDAQNYKNHLANYLGRRCRRLESYSDEELQRQWTSQIRLAWRDRSAVIPDLTRDCEIELDLRAIEPPFDEVADVFDAALRKAASEPNPEVQKAFRCELGRFIGSLDLDNALN